MKNNLRPPWQPGQSGNPKGRSVGSRSKLSEKFLQALHDDFAEHGPGVIERVRKKQPGVYLKVVASLMPREFNVRSEPLFEGMTNETLRDLIDQIRCEITARAGTSSDLGVETPSSDKRLN
jgi:hypothetical protein